MLLDAIRDGVASTSWSSDTFANAAAVNEEAGRYVDLVGREHPSELLDSAAVVVKPEVVSVQRNAGRAGVMANWTAPPSVGVQRNVLGLGAVAGPRL